MAERAERTAVRSAAWRAGRPPAGLAFVAIPAGHMANCTNTAFQMPALKQITGAAQPFDHGGRVPHQLQAKVVQPERNANGRIDRLDAMLCHFRGQIAGQLACPLYRFDCRRRCIVKFHFYFPLLDPAPPFARQRLKCFPVRMDSLPPKWAR